MNHVLFESLQMEKHVHIDIEIYENEKFVRNISFTYPSKQNVRLVILCVLYNKILDIKVITSAFIVYFWIMNLNVCI